MAEPFLSEIRIMSFNFPPRGWAFCDGQLLPINQNQALFSLLGTTYGGDGRTNFALPNLQGRTPIHVGSGHTLGETGGVQASTLSIAALPEHAHILSASPAAGTTPGANGAFLANAGSDVYVSPQHLVPMSPWAVGNVGGGQPHENMQPYLALSFCIALQGIFPSPN